MSGNASGPVRVWGTTTMERADGTIFYRSPEQAYNTSDTARSKWESLRCHYCQLSRNDSISDQYKFGTPVPENLTIANTVLLSKVLLKEVRKWLKERF